MQTQVDTRGLSCPQPVILVQKAIKQGADELVVLLDNEVSKENVIRFAEGKFGMKSTYTSDNGEITLRLFK